MKKEEKVRYQCVSGYIDDIIGAYEVGDNIEGIGEVQYIDGPCLACGEINCICEEA